MNLFGHKAPLVADLVRCRHRIYAASPAFHTDITLGIVLAKHEDYYRVLLQNGTIVLAHVGDIEVLSGQS
jgi:hypothetical protein